MIAAGLCYSLIGLHILPGMWKALGPTGQKHIRYGQGGRPEVNLRSLYCHPWRSIPITATAIFQPETELGEATRLPARRTLNRRQTYTSTSTRSAQELTTSISKCTSLQDLLQLCTASKDLNYIHAAAALTCLAKLIDRPLRSTYGTRNKPSSRVVLDACPTIHAVCTLAHSLTPQFQPRAVANALWACSKLIQAVSNAHRSAMSQASMNPTAVANSRAAHACLCDLTCSLLTMLPEAAANFEPQHFSNTIYALGVIHSTQSGHSTHQQPADSHVPSPHLTRLMPNPTSNIPQSGTCGRQGSNGLQILEAGLLRAAAAQVLPLSLSHVSHSSPQGLSNMLYGLAQLGHQPEDVWMDLTLDTLMDKRKDMEAQHVANCMWALAKQAYFPGEDWLELILDHAVTQPHVLSTITAQGLVNILWACAVLKATPQHHVLMKLLELVKSMAPGFVAQDVSNVTWALADLWRLVQPPGTTRAGSSDAGSIGDFEQDASGAQQLLGQGHHQQIQNEHNRQQQQVIEDAAMHVLKCFVMEQPEPATSAPAPGGEASATTRGLFHTTGSVPSPLGAQAYPTENSPTAASPGSRWAHVVSALQRPAVLDATPQHFANVLWGVSVLRLALSRVWYGRYWRASYLPLLAMDRNEIAMIMLAVGRLRVVPPPPWWARVEQISMRQLPGAGSKYMAHCVWAMARLNLRPSDVWMREFSKQVKYQGGLEQMTPKASVCISRALSTLGVKH